MPDIVNEGLRSYAETRGFARRAAGCRSLHSLDFSSQPFASGDHLTKVLCELRRRSLRQEFPVMVRCCAIVGGRLLP